MPRLYVELDMDDTAFQSDPLDELRIALAIMQHDIQLSCEADGGEVAGKGTVETSTGVKVGTWEIR